MYYVILTIGVLLAIAFDAAALSLAPLQVSVSKERVCLVDHAYSESFSETRSLSCWNEHGKEEKGYWNKPVAVAVGSRLGGVPGDYLCAATAQGVRCQGKFAAEIEAFYKDFKDPILMASGPFDLCVVDRLKGLRCNGGDLPYTEIANVPPTAKSPKAIAIGTMYACILGEDDRPQCWGGATSRYFGFLPAPVRAKAVEIKKAITSIPHSIGGLDTLSVGFTHACGTTKGVPQTQCWGLDFSGETNPIPLEMIAGTVVEASVFRTCAVSAGKLSCTGQAAKELSPIFQERPRPLRALTSNKEDYDRFRVTCFVDDDTLRCRGRFSLDVPHKSFGFDLNRFEHSLANLRPSLHSEKSGLIKEVALLGESLPNFNEQESKLAEASPRLFLLMALEPFLNKVGTRYFKEQVVPPYSLTLNYYREKYGVNHLAGLTLSQETLRSSLVILKSALEGIKSYLPLEDHPELRPLKGLLGRLLEDKTRPISRDDVSNVCDKLNAPEIEKVLEQIQRNPRLWAMAPMIDSMKSFLEAVQRQGDLW